MKRGWKGTIWIPLVLLGVLGVLYGAYRNEATLLFSRASMICLECIGIG